MGGAVLGLATVLRLAGPGRVLGVSGALGSLLPSPDPLSGRGWSMQNLGNAKMQALFLGAMMAGGALVAPLATSALSPGETLPASRALIAGVVSGVGVVAGNGCTSGHGLCGNARGSPRSMVATMAMMAGGAASSHFFDTLGALEAADAALDPALYPRGAGTALSQPLLTLGKATGLGPYSAVAALAALAAIPAARAAVLARRDPAAFAAARRSPAGRRRARLLGLAADAGSGLLFGAGLALSGMTNPRKVAGFLQFAATRVVGAPAGRPLGSTVPATGVMKSAWDPSLAFVMGAGLLVAAPLTFWVLQASRHGGGGGAGRARLSPPTPTRTQTHSLPQPELVPVPLHRRDGTTATKEKTSLRATARSTRMPTGTTTTRRGRLTRRVAQSRARASQRSRPPIGGAALLHGRGPTRRGSACLLREPGVS